MKYQKLENQEANWKWIYLIRKHREGEKITRYVSRSEIEVTWYTERLSDEKWEECYGDN